MSERTSERLFEILSKYLGPNNARVAVKTFSAKAAGVEPEELTPAKVPALLEGLRPMLRTLLGAEAAEKLLEGIPSFPDKQIEKGLVAKLSRVEGRDWAGDSVRAPTEVGVTCTR